MDASSGSSCPGPVRNLWDPLPFGVVVRSNFTHDFYTTSWQDLEVVPLLT